jgi:nucleotide-binding universal stress UspA family protein
MTSALALQLAVSAVISLSSPEMERQAAHHLTEQFERVGRAVPVLDESLTRAARTLAEDALQTSAKEAANVLSVSQAVSDAEGYDPSPRALVIRGSPPDQALASFLARTDVTHEAASRMGIGASIRGEGGALVALLVTRKVALRSFPAWSNRAAPRSCAGSWSARFVPRMSSSPCRTATSIRPLSRWKALASARRSDFRSLAITRSK